MCNLPLVRVVQDWRLYIVQEFCDGGPLRALYGDRKLWPATGLADLVSGCVLRYFGSVALGPVGFQSALLPRSLPAFGWWPVRTQCDLVPDRPLATPVRTPMDPNAHVTPPAWGRGRVCVWVCCTRGLPDRQLALLHPQPSIVSLGLGISRALAHLHSKRIIHGDLNPNNVLLKRDHVEPSGYGIKVGDFGLR